MSNQNEFQYIEAKSFSGLPVIEVSDAKSFTRFANRNDIEFIFRITTNEQTAFFFTADNILYKLNGGGFKTLADMNEAQKRELTDAAVFYETSKNESGEEFQAARKAGFVDGFTAYRSKFATYNTQTLTANIPADLDSPEKLYKYALSKGLKTYAEFEKVYDAGFPDLLTYNDAKSKGFTDGATYEDATKRGFNTADEYNKANKLHIENKKELNEYEFLEDLNRNRHYSFDQLQLLIALSNLDNGSIVSVKKARELLEAAQDKIKKPTGTEGRKVMPIWYTRSIDSDPKMIEFLSKNEELKKFGFFHTGKQAFEIFKASAIKILVDGSNVAFNSSKKKPELKNIRLVIDELKFRKFKNVIIYTDASLKHNVKDLPLLEEIKKECEYIETPSKTQADEFLIAAAKKERSLIVTNDTFSDWKMKDKWVKDKFDDIRVPFTISKNDMVILKGMDKFTENLVSE